MKTQVSPAPEQTIRIRRAEDRGQAEHGWLHARFTFSFAEYYDPAHMGFHSLRVMNNDTIEPGGGFPLHPHRDMEIFTYVIQGQLEHRDSLGNGAVIQAGDLQYMSAGSGIRHSEFNPSRTEPTHLYQVWLQPNTRGGSPRYAEIHLAQTAPKNGLRLLFSPDGREESIAIRQDATISFGSIEKRAALTLPSDAEHPHTWVQVVTGSVQFGDHTLHAADGLQLESTPTDASLTALEDATLLVFQLASFPES